VLAYTSGRAMWTMFVFFAWILALWLLLIVFDDLFSRRDSSGRGSRLVHLRDRAVVARHLRLADRQRERHGRAQDEKSRPTHGRSCTRTSARSSGRLVQWARSLR
jgi:hypothetical protein